MPGDKQPFPAGVSANPGGRPKKTEEMREAEALARKLSPEIIRRLAQIALEGEDAHAAIKAGNSILDRAFGKPVQAISGPDGEPLTVAFDAARLTDEQLRAFVTIGRAALVESGGTGGSGGGTPAT